MASIWKLAGADIYVDKQSGDKPPHFAELRPIGSTSSIFHEISNPTEAFAMEGTVIGETFFTTLRDTGGDVTTLITDLVPGGMSVFVENVTYDRLNYYKQTVDTAQADDVPTYRMSFVLRPQ